MDGFVFGIQWFGEFRLDSLLASETDFRFGRFAECDVYGPVVGGRRTLDKRPMMCLEFVSIKQNPPCIFGIERNIIRAVKVLGVQVTSDG